MNNILGKWMYNAGSDVENWRCEEEFDTREEAVRAGLKYFTEPDGYEDYEGVKFEGEAFTVGQIMSPEFHIDAWNALDPAMEQAGEQCGDWSSSWLEKIAKEDESLLSKMLTDAFKEWLKLTKNEPNFYTIKHVTKTNIYSNELWNEANHEKYC